MEKEMYVWAVRLLGNGDTFSVVAYSADVAIETARGLLSKGCSKDLISVNMVMRIDAVAGIAAS